MSLPTMNTLDFLKACHPFLEIAPWVTAGGAPGTWTPIGTVDGIEVSYEGTVKDIVADTAPYALDSFIPDIKAGLKGNLHEADMRKLFVIMGIFTGTHAAPTNPGIVQVTSTIDGTATGLVGAPTVSYWQARLTIDDQSFKSYTTAETLYEDNTYTKRTYTFWRTMFAPKIKHNPKRDDWMKTGFEMKILYDTSVTTADKMFKVVDFMLKTG